MLWASFEVFLNAALWKLGAWTMDMTTLTNEEVFGLWADALKELRRRGVTRSANSPVADYGELLVAQRLSL